MTTEIAVPAARSRRRSNTMLVVAVGVGAFAALAPTIASGNARNTAGTGAMERPLVAVLTGAAETPAAGDTDGNGVGVVTINPTTGELCADLRVANVAAITAAHIHRGVVGVAGPVEVSLPAPTPTSAGCVTILPALAVEIIATPASFYVNVHNAEFPGGALRGQLNPSGNAFGIPRILPEPVRAYDSRANGDGVLANGSTRTISLGRGVNSAGTLRLAIPAGASAAMVRVTATGTSGSGYLTLYSAALAAEPTTSALNWYEAGSTVGSDATVAIDAEAKVKVTARDGSTHVVIDVIGYLF